MISQQIRRREFITLLGGAAAAWPLEARAQQGGSVRRVGMLSSASANDSAAQRSVGAFLQGLTDLGWTEGRSVRFDYRWSGGNTDLYPRYVAELLALTPDVVVANGGSTVAALQKASRTVPIVFTGAVDPVASGLVASLARPGGNATGFITIEQGVSGKWLELLNEIAPFVRRVGVLRDPTTTGQASQLGVIQAVAPSIGIQVIPLDVHDTGGIERIVSAFSHDPKGGLIVPTGALFAANRELIVTIAARQRLPAVYSGRAYVAAGGLISYAPVISDQFRRAAGYVDRILKGEKPADLPVQAPVKYETVLNMKTAKALGLEVPTSVLLRADEVIE